MTTWIAVTRIISGAEYEYIINLDRVECIIPEYAKGHCRIAFSDDAFEVKETYKEIFDQVPKKNLPHFLEREKG